MPTAELLIILIPVFSEMINLYAWTRLLHMRNAWLFCVVEVLIVVFCGVFLVSGNNPARLIVFFFNYVIFPFAMSDEGVGRKLVVIALMNIVVIVAEFIGGTTWAMISGISVATNEAVAANLSTFLFMHVVHKIALITLLFGLWMLLRKSDRTAEAAWRAFFWFPLVQGAMLSLLLSIGLYSGQPNQELFAGASCAALLCVVADVLLVFFISAYARKAKADQQAELLQQELDSYLEHCEPLANEVAHVAQMRHDVRNQAQAALVLAARGEHEQARSLLQAMSRELETPDHQAAALAGVPVRPEVG